MKKQHKNKEPLRGAQRLVPRKHPVAAPEVNRQDFTQTKEEKIATYNARLSFNVIACWVSMPLYAYGTFWKQTFPESYQEHLNFIDKLTTQYNIPYDPQFERFYLGSFAGAACIFISSQIYADGFIRHAANVLIENFKNTSIHIDDIPKYDTAIHGLNHTSSRNAFAAAAIGLTTVETASSYLPNRSFDYGDMTAYTLAAALYLGGLSLVTRRASQKLKCLPENTGP